MRSRAFAGALIAPVLIAGLAALAGMTQAASAAVAIDGSRFLPQSVSVNVGETVTWTNRDPAQHTATAPGAFDTGVLAMGQSRAVQLNAAGTFEYRCAIHGAMTGTVRVLALATATAAPPTPVPTPVRTPTPAPATAAPTASPTPTPSPTASPTPSPTPAPTAAASAVAQRSPSPRSDPPALTAAPPVGPDSGPGPTLAVVAGALAAGLVGLGVYLARRR